MKSFVKRIGFALAVCAMTSLMAFADVKSDKVTFTEDLTVNGTVVKKGTYRVMFDDQTGELTIAKDNKQTVAKTKARMGLNPATREPMKIKAAKTVRFKASKVLKEAV